MRRLRASSMLLAPLLVTICGACATDDGFVKLDIVSGIPWSAPESLEYVIRDGDDVKGRATLSISEGADGLVLTERFSDDEGNSDESATTVRAFTLKPIAMTRTIRNADRRTVAEATYEDDVVRIRQSNFEPADASTPESTRSNPLRVPEHSYDNHTSLFIWRTIRFEKGYNVAYTSVLSNVREKQTFTLTVAGEQRVETPAGQFDAWHVKIVAGDREQDAWFATSDDHRLLVYDNGSEVLVFAGPTK